MVNIAKRTAHTTHSHTNLRLFESSHKDWSKAYPNLRMDLHGGPCPWPSVCVFLLISRLNSSDGWFDVFIHSFLKLRLNYVWLHKHLCGFTCNLPIRNPCCLYKSVCAVLNVWTRGVIFGARTFAHTKKNVWANLFVPKIILSFINFGLCKQTCTNSMGFLWANYM